jgi:cytochrome oxidase Cu insertion factor (SCO1/SenC/PrrC family)
MSGQSPPFEPVTPDPRKLRLTAWILVAIMVIGGFLILRSYERWTVKSAEDDRPRFFYRITKERDLRVMRQDGEVADLWDLNGKVWCVHVIARSQPETTALTTSVMRRLATAFENEPDFALVTLVVDPIPREELEQSLARIAEDLGSRLPQWWVATNDAVDLHRFIKNQLKAGVFPHLDDDGRWRFDTTISLIDRNRHIRHAVVPQKNQPGQPYLAAFDFDEAAGWDAQGILTGTDRSNVDELEALLETTIRRLLVEEPEAQKGPSLGWIAGVLLLTVLIFIYQANRRRLLASRA